MKKTLNVLGIIMAALLSVVLVLMLIVTPIVFSTLSLLDAQTITNVITDTLTAGQNSEPSAESVQVVTLSNVVQTNDTAEDVGKDVLSGIFGDSIGQEQFSAILSSKAAKELLEAYTEDLTGALTGSNQEAKFNAEKIKSIVNDNIDEIVEVLRTNIPECANMDAEELKSNIQKAVDEGAEEMIQALPKPEDVKRQLAESVPALETALEILAMKDTIKLIVIGAIVLLSGLVFVCRLPNLRGFRWLAIDLFVGGGVGAFVTVGLLVSKSAVGEIAKQASAQIAGAVGSLLGAFTTGMLVRSLVMLAFGGAMLTAHILLNKLKAKRLAAVEMAEQLHVTEGEL